MRENFDACLTELLRHEGGYVNHPRDPGGETNMGISRRAYPAENIRGMTRARAAQIYRRDFWDAVKCDDLPSGLDAVAFDAAVNSGPARAVRWLQSAVGAAADGKIGPATLAAARGADPIPAINRALDARLGFMRSLGTWPTFGKGWQRRVDELRAFAARLAEGAKPAPKPPPVMPRPMPTPPPAEPAASVLTLAAIAAGIAILAAAFFGS